MNDVARRYFELLDISQGRDPYDPSRDVDTAKGMVRWMDAESTKTSITQTDLERIDREISACRDRINLLTLAHPKYQEMGFRCMILEEEAADYTRRNLYADAEFPSELARLLRSQVIHWSKCVTQEKELLVSLQMNREAVCKRIMDAQ